MKFFFVFFLCAGLSLFSAWDSGANLLIIPVANFNSSDISSGLPAGWILDKKTGKPLMRIKKEDDVFYLNLISFGDSSFGIRKEVRVDVKKFPILC